VRSRVSIIAGLALVVFLFIILAMLRWGGYLLISSQKLPSHADGAVILQASVVSEDARIAGAVRLLQQNTVDKVLLSIPKKGYWDLSLPPLVHRYLGKQYGNEIADRIEFCETVDAHSTEDEARSVMPCIEQRHWHSFIVVTSNFHSRRAGLIWRRTWKHVQPPVQMWVDGVPDPLFQPAGWWRHREYAKTWFLESTKLLWTLGSLMRNKYPGDVQSSAH
jgi:uncharacterized SAM-binding protein YcdF (DUF218 family)